MPGNSFQNVMTLFIRGWTAVDHQSFRIFTWSKESEVQWSVGEDEVLSFPKLEKNILYGVYPDCIEFFTADSAHIGRETCKRGAMRSLQYFITSVSLNHSPSP